ncbi:hypothetical protein DSECCO2_638760 [anaerobic digester metagenome]
MLGQQLGEKRLRSELLGLQAPGQRRADVDAQDVDGRDGQQSFHDGIPGQHPQLQIQGEGPERKAVEHHTGLHAGVVCVFHGLCAWKRLRSHALTRFRSGQSVARNSLANSMPHTVSPNPLSSCLRHRRALMGFF